MRRNEDYPSYYYKDIEGTAEIALERSAGEPFRELKVYGESVQEGTPSPDNPIPVKSVGERTRNLLDVKTAPMIHNVMTSDNKLNVKWERTKTGFKGSFVNDYASVSYRVGYILGNTEDFKDKTLTISLGEAILNQGARPTIALLLTSKKGSSVDSIDENTTFAIIKDGYIGDSATVSALGSNHNVASTQKYYTFTIPADADSETYPYLSVVFYIGINATENPAGSTFKFKNIQVEVGDTPTDYEPYGYKADIEVMGKNLLDIQNVDKTLIRCVLENVNNGVKIIATENNAAGYISINLNDIVTVGETYSISFVSERSGSTGGGIRVTIDGELSINMLNYTGGYYNGTFTAGTTNILMLYACTNSGYIDDFAIFKDIQLEEGDTATPYEPYQEPIRSTIYLKEPLRKIGDYADELDVVGEKAVRNIFEYTFTDKCVWGAPQRELDTTIRSYSNYENIPRVYSGLTLRGFSEKGVFINSGTSDSDFECCQFSNTTDTNSTFFVRILKSRCADPENPIAADFANIYTPGTKVYGVRETPIEETILLSDEIKALKRNCQLRVKTGLSPSKIKAQYYRY